MEDDKVAHHKDAIKKIKQDLKRNLRNRMVKTNYRNRIRDLRAAIDAGKADDAKAALQPTLSAIDRAAAKGVLAANTASRYKSRLTKAVQAMGKSTQAA
jgi:small subunit ribosomal protein S20